MESDHKVIKIGEWRDAQFLLEAVQSRRFLIWDFDGTIVDCRIDWEALKLELAGLLPQCDSQALDSGMNNLIYRLQDMGKHEDVFTVLQRYERAARPVINEQLVAFIRYSNGRFRMNIWSDNLRETIESILRHERIIDAFECIIAKEDVTRYKPDPEGLKKAVEAFKREDQADLKNMLFIGDSWKDDQAAKAIGVPFYSVKI